MLGICFIQKKKNENIPNKFSTSFPTVNYGFFLYIKNSCYVSISIKFIDSTFNMVNLIHSSH